MDTLNRRHHGHFCLFLARKLGLRLKPMPWKARSTLDERKVFLEEWRKQETSFAELCREFQVSRQTGYKWLGRYEAEGESGLHSLEQPAINTPAPTVAMRNKRVMILFISKLV